MQKRTQKTTRVVWLILLLIGVFISLPSRPVQAQPAPDGNSVLILDSTVSGGAGSREAVLAGANGFTVVVDSGAAWGARTTADFATFRAIILGDPTCVASTGPITAAEANKAVWGPAINGNVIINGTDPVFHQSQGGDSLTEGSIKFAADEPTKTGAYISLSCYYAFAGAGTPVPVLDPFGSFTVLGQFLFSSCPQNTHIVAVHPALSGITDATLSNWSCSAHEAFDTYPSDFLVLAINSDISSTFTAPDGTVGGPYILARGKTLSPILCGNGILEATEECDDGNTTNGDGCSAQCKIEVPVCGNGKLDPGEQCDDGNTNNNDACKNDCTPNVCGDGVVFTGVEECDDGANGDNGDGCTDSCLINFDPDCSKAAASPAVLWPPNHKGVDISIVGVTDPDGNPLTITPTSVYQDEQVSKVTGDGAGATSPDASLSPLQVRAERNGNPKTPGNGRVYHISFTADDGVGGSCTGEVLVCVPHDQGGKPTCIDEGPLYNSLLP